MIDDTESIKPEPFSFNNEEPSSKNLDVTKKIQDCAQKAHIVPDPDEAARKLQRAWKQRQKDAGIKTISRDSIPNLQQGPRKSQWKFNPKSELMFGPIVKGPHGPKHEIPLETIEKVVGNLIAANDREGLRRLANVLFTGPLKIQRYQMLVESHPSVKELINFFKTKDTNLEKLNTLFIQAVKEWRSGNDQPAFATTEYQAKREQEEDIDPSVDTFVDRRKDGPDPLDPDQEIEITHGGGEWNIMEFLRGEHEGYQLERGGVGLQVSPTNSDTENRSKDYSKMSFWFFDNRAILSAKIAPKYLKAAPLGYEAGLTASSVGYLKDIKVTVLDTGKIWEMTEKGWKESDRHFKNDQTGDQTLKS